MELVKYHNGSPCSVSYGPKKKKRRGKKKK